MKRDVFPSSAISFVPRAIIVIVVLVTIGAFRAGAGVAHASGGGHAPIVIQGDSDFTTCSCVASESGTANNPYIIGPLAINNADGNTISIDGTKLTKSFELLNLTIAGNRAATDTGIVLNHINPGGSQAIVAKVYGVQTSIQTNNVGILVEHSSYVTLDGGGENPTGMWYL